LSNGGVDLERIHQAAGPRQAASEARAGAVAFGHRQREIGDAGPVVLDAQLDAEAGRILGVFDHAQAHHAAAGVYGQIGR
jgi:hypothetical protein